MAFFTYYQHPVEGTYKANLKEANYIVFEADTEEESLEKAKELELVLERYELTDASNSACIRDRPLKTFKIGGELSVNVFYRNGTLYLRKLKDEENAE